MAEPSPYPSSRAKGHERYDAIRDLVGIAQQEWSNGDKWFAKEIWESVGRVYGEYVLHDSVLQTLAE